MIKETSHHTPKSPMPAVAAMLAMVATTVISLSRGMFRFTRSPFTSLRLKVTLAVISTGVFIVASILVISYPFEQERRAYRLENIHRFIRTLFEQNRAQLANEIYARQQEAMEISIQNMQDLDDISCVILHDLDGRCLAAVPMAVSQIPEKIATFDTAAMDDLPRFRRTTFLKTPHTEFISPIKVIGVHVGYIRILYDLSAYTREARLIFIFSGTICLFLILIIVLLNLFLSQAVLQPTSRLKEAMENLQKGDLTTRVTISSCDEMGQMARAFNAMSEKLNRQHRELIQAIDIRAAYARKLNQSNQALEQLNTTLEERVEKRTRELKNANRRLEKEMMARQETFQEKQNLEKRLTRSRKMETLGLVAGGVAHDLNNVLSGIVSYPDLLLMDLDKAHPMHAPLNTIKESGTKAAAIVQDLLTLTRRGVVTNNILNLAQLIEEYLCSPEHHRLMAFHPAIGVNSRIHTNVMNIKGSPVHLKKTIMNLVTNAAEAQPHGGEIAITVENRHVDTPVKGYQEIPRGDYVVMAVSDAGMGISQEEQEHIFEPFYTKKTMGRSGTGLGMAVVWGTLQDHRGYIDIKSREGQGTTFSLFFPVTTAPLPRKTRVNPLAAHMGNGQTILVVDDVTAQTDLATLFLTRLGYTPVAVNSGEAAVDYLKAHTADLVILDMIMAPGMDGLETYEKILEIHPRQRAVIVSGYAENDRVKTMQQSGAGPYVKKPYTLETIGRVIKKELNRKPREPLVRSAQ